MPIHLATHRRTLRLLRQDIQLPFGAQRFLALLEGVEGGFAISASIVIGLSFTQLDRRLLLITAAISILVNGFNNAAVKYSSEHYGDELDGQENRSALRSYFIPAAIEFVAYFAIGLLTLVPLMILPHMLLALTISCSITLVMLFAAGYWRGLLLRLHPVRDGFEMMLLGIAIIIVGGLTGYLLDLFSLR